MAKPYARPPEPHRSSVEGVDPLPAAPAPWLADLPKDSRGFLVPAEAPWEDGQPQIAALSPDRKLALGFSRACAVCGYPLALGRPVFRGFAQPDAASIRTSEREMTHDGGGPCHASCMYFSAFACPHMREPTARLGRESQFGAGKRRGLKAAVMGFEDAALLIYAHPHILGDPSAPPTYFAYRQLVEDSIYGHGHELVERYQQAVIDDAPHIDMTAPRLYWTDSEDDAKAMSRLAQDVRRRLQRTPPANKMTVLGQPYVVYPLPLI